MFLKNVSLGFISLVSILAVSRAQADCAVGKLEELKASPVLAQIADLLPADSLSAGSSYQWRLKGEHRPFTVFVAPNRPNTLYVKTEELGYLPIREICSDGTKTSISMNSSYGPIRILLEKINDRYFSTVFLDGSVHKGRTELNPQVAVIPPQGQVATQRPQATGRN